MLESPGHALICEIVKEPPGTDAFVEMREATGLVSTSGRARDGQPDIHLRFRLAGGKRCLSVLGDSKRSSKAKGLFRDGLRTATYYMMAFGPCLGMTMGADGIGGAVKPAFTLFFRQGVELPEAMRQALRNDNPAQRPLLLALDISHVAPEVVDRITAPYQDGEPRQAGMQDSLLVPWFQGIARQARQYLENARAR